MMAFEILSVILVIFDLSTINAFNPRQNVSSSRFTLADLAPTKYYDVARKYLHDSLYPSTSTSCSSVKLTNSSFPILYPTDYGGDPLGINDSTDAFKKVISIALTRGNPSVALANNIHDCDLSI